MARKQIDVPLTYMRIELEQHDQDFRWFILKYEGIRAGANDLYVPVYRIVEAGPFQNWFWKDKLIDSTTINVECRPGILMGEEWKVLNYPVVAIQRGAAAERMLSAPQDAEHNAAKD